MAAIQQQCPIAGLGESTSRLHIPEFHFASMFAIIGHAELMTSVTVAQNGMAQIAGWGAAATGHVVGMNG